MRLHKKVRVESVSRRHFGRDTGDSWTHGERGTGTRHRGTGTTGGRVTGLGTTEERCTVRYGPPSVLERWTRQDRGSCFTGHEIPD